MTPSQVAVLLGMCAAYDSRTVGESDVVAWHAILDKYHLADAREAVIEHYTRSRDRIMPADVVAAARKARSDRVMRRMQDIDLELDDDTPQSDVFARRRLLALAADPEWSPPEPGSGFDIAPGVRVRSMRPAYRELESG